MTIDEAIKVNKDILGDEDYDFYLNEEDAIQLGIEALELKQKLYELYMNHIVWAEAASKLIKAPLPSETDSKEV